MDVPQAQYLASRAVSQEWHQEAWSSQQADPTLSTQDADVHTAALPAVPKCSSHRPLLTSTETPFQERTRSRSVFTPLGAV